MLMIMGRSAFLCALYEPGHMDTKDTSGQSPISTQQLSSEKVLLLITGATITANIHIPKQPAHLSSLKAFNTPFSNPQ
jgi:hypothetical protein